MTILLPLPEDVDIGGMPHFPLHDERLRRSRAWLICKRRPELGFYLLNLWTRAFREQPAGSIDADEDVLADAADCYPEKWAQYRNDAMRGWVLIDGRYHHPFVCELVWDLWLKRTEERFEKAKQRWKKADKRAREDGEDAPEPLGDYGAWLAREFPATAARLAALSVPGTKAVCPGDKDGLSLGQNGNGVGTNGERCGDGSGTNHDPPGTEGDCLTENALKVREGKVVVPPYPPVDELGKGAREGKEAGAQRQGSAVGLPARSEGKRWFDGELARLRDCFGGDAGTVQSYCGGPRKMVELFRDCVILGGNPGRWVKLGAKTPARAAQIRTVLDLVGWPVTLWPDGCEVVVHRARKSA